MSNSRSGKTVRLTVAQAVVTYLSKQYSVADGRNGIGPGHSFNADSGAWEVSDPDKGANRYAIAVGVNYLLTPNATLKTEYRYDGASQPVFFDAKSGTFRKGNSLLGASVVVSF